MTGIRIDGIVIAKAVKDRVKKAVDELKKQGINPCLATILVGDNQASSTYVKNKDRSVHGILVQLPLPNQLDEFIITSRISPLKDVDGLTPHNVGLLAMKKAALVACTPLGVMEMFDYHNIELKGKNIVLINRSNLVGKPLYHLLLARDATVIT